MMNSEISNLTDYINVDKDTKKEEIKVEDFITLNTKRKIFLKIIEEINKKNN